MKTVWAVQSGSVFEGGGINCICVSEELARLKALEVVKKDNDQYTKWNEDKDYDFKLYQET